MKLFYLSSLTPAAAPPSLRPPQRERAIYFIAGLIGLLALLSLASARAAELSAGVDRKEVMMNEHVVLTLSLINSDTRLRAEGISPNVDLSVLTQDFDIGTPHVENRYNIYRGRGRSTSELSVDLFPRHDGPLTIPAFSVDGLSTAPIVIAARKLPPGALPDIFSKAGVSAASVWQRQQVVAWLDVYHRVQLKTASVGEYLSTEPLAIELMEHQDLPQSERKETVRGVGYDVTRIAWAIFPKQSGALTIYLPDVWAVTADGRKLRLPNQQQRVEVKALPAEVTADIAVGRLDLMQTALAPAPSVNNVSTWAVTVRGPFSRFALPDTLPLPPSPASVKIDVDHAQRNTEIVTAGMTSVVTYTLSLLPQSGGAFALPPLRVPYFDPERGVLAVAELPERNFTVAASAAPAVAAVSAKAASDNAAQQTAVMPGNPALVWQLATLLFALLWIATAIMLWKRPRPHISNAPRNAPHRFEPAPPASHHPLQAQLLAAFDSRTLEEGLRVWESQYGDDQTLRDTVRAVQRLCYGNVKDVDAAALRRDVETAAAKIRGAAPRAAAAANDPWRPEAFVIKPSQQ